MERLGLVVAPDLRAWRPYAGPVAFLLIATLAIAGLRSQLHHGSTGTAASTRHTAVQHRRANVHSKPLLYTVRAGDTITAIAARTGVPMTRLLRLNPKAQPTALFIGEKIHLR